MPLNGIGTYSLLGDESLEKLNIGYVDLMILHHPGTNDVKAYKAMEKAVEEGKIRSIGLSNWYIEELKEFLPQVILRWNLQKGVVVIPGSSNPEHIQENTGIYDFELTDEEMARINALNRDEKHDWY